MTEHGWEKDDCPAISERVMAADILVVGTSIWLGEKTSVATQVIERRIYLIRSQKVLLDRDLAELYDVSTKALNQAVSRNRDRFPEVVVGREEAATQDSANGHMSPSLVTSAIRVGW